MINLSQTLKKRRKYLIFFVVAKQCSLINTKSDLPSALSKKTHKLLSTIHVTSDGILKIIKNLNKPHGHDMISIRMKTCKPLELIFRSYLENGKFPTEWKKLMWFQHTKKEINKS